MFFSSHITYPGFIFFLSFGFIRKPQASHLQFSKAVPLYTSRTVRNNIPCHKSQVRSELLGYKTLPWFLVRLR